MTTPVLAPVTAAQELLLTAGLASGAKAVEAWRRWRSAHDLEGLDQASFRLLPLVARNRGVVSEDDPLFGALRGIHRKAWIENVRLFAGLGAALAALEAAGVPALVLKGAALVADAYDDAGLRPMSDVDLLVPPDRVDAAFAALAGAGYSAEAPVGTLVRRHAVGFRAARDAYPSLDLHVRPLAVRTPRAFDAALLADARPRTLTGGTRILVPDPTRHLVVVLAHAARRTAVGGARWIADATLLVRRRGDAIDWDRFVDATRRCRFVEPARAGLRAIREAFEAPVPDDVLDRLDATPRGVCEKVEAAAAFAAGEGARDLAGLAAPWFRLPEVGASRLRAAADLVGPTLGRGAWLLWKHGLRRPWRRLTGARRVAAIAPKA